jgi:hypothetical protein
MRRSVNHVLLVIAAIAIEPACKRHCEAGENYLAEWDYNHGDRCPLELSSAGTFEFSPDLIRLAPSIDGAASKGTFTISAFIDADKVTVADGYVVDVETAMEDADGCVGVTLAHASAETPCFIESDSLLRCLLDATGTTTIEVSSTRSTPGTCRLNVSSGNSGGDPEKPPNPKKPSVVTVEVANPAEAQAIAIHSPLEEGTTCDAKTPCTLVGKLAAGVCTPEGAPLLRTAEFYVATERGGVLASNSAALNVTATVVGMGSGRADIHDKDDCQQPSGADITIAEGKAMSALKFLCADGGAGVYQIVAVADITGKSDTLVVAAPAAPYRITATKTANDGTPGGETTGEGTTGEGTTGESTADPSPGAEFTYTVNVTDLDSAGIPDLAVEIVTDDNATHRVVTDAFGSAIQELPADLSTLRIHLPAWDFACKVEIP